MAITTGAQACPGCEQPSSLFVHFARAFYGVCSQSFCPYCRNTKKVMNAKGIPLVVVELDQRTDGALMQVLLPPPSPPPQPPQPSTPANADVESRPSPAPARPPALFPPRTRSTPTHAGDSWDLHRATDGAGRCGSCARNRVPPSRATPCVARPSPPTALLLSTGLTLVTDRAAADDWPAHRPQRLLQR